MRTKVAKRTLSRRQVAKPAKSQAEPTRESLLAEIATRLDARGTLLQGLS